MMQDKLKGAGKKVELIVYPDLDHHLEDSAARADMLRRSDAFLRRISACSNEGPDPTKKGGLRPERRPFCLA